MLTPRYTHTRIAAYIGYTVQAIINNFLPILFIALQNVYRISYEQLGRLIVVNFLTQLFTDILTPKIVAVTGYKKAAVLCQGLAAAGLVLLVFLPRLLPSPYLGIVISIVVYAFASGLIEVILSPLIEALPSSNRRGAMSILHSFYCWGQAFTAVGTTLLILLFGYRNWFYVPLIWAIVPLINLFNFWRAPVIEPPREQQSGNAKKLLANPLFRTFMVIMLCAGASEIAMAQWASLFAQQALGVSKTVGDLAGPCAFALFMGTGRLLYARFAARLSFRRVLLLLSGVCSLCYLTAAFTASPVLSLAACALCGFTVSVFWPGTYSAGAVEFPGSGTMMYSLFAMCGDLGCCSGPWLVGLIADQAGLKIGLAASAVFPVILFVAVLFFYHSRAELCQSGCKTPQNSIQ